MSTTPPSSPSAKRLVSLDLLRGIDIFMLTVVCAIVEAYGRYSAKFSGGPLPQWFLDQFDHPRWVGFSAWDLVMPLFIFMAGAALPLALPKRLDDRGRARGKYWGHVLSRVLMLWFWGMLAQGCLTHFNLGVISFFNNTLQTIAVGYLITAAVARIPNLWARLAVPFLLAAAYTVLLHTLGDFSETGNFAVVYETKFLAWLYPEAYAKQWCVAQIARMHYTWWTTIPMFGVLSLAGYHATEIVLSKWTGLKKTLVLALVGVGLVGLGFALLYGLGDPCIKHIFTPSFTSLALGACFLFFALAYLFADVLQIRKGYSLLLLFGRHSLLAYLLAETCLSSLVWSVINALFANTPVRAFCDKPGKVQGLGLARFMEPETQQLVASILFGIVLTVILWYAEQWAVRTRAAKKLAAQARDGQAEPPASAPSRS